MPIQVSEHTLTAKSTDYFARVLRNDASAREALEHALAAPGHRAFQAVFNGSPVALLLLREEDDGCRPVTLVVHPATRGRGVGSEFARQAAGRLGDSLALPEDCRDFAARAGL